MGDYKTFDETLARMPVAIRYAWCAFSIGGLAVFLTCLVIVVAYIAGIPILAIG